MSTIPTVKLHDGHPMPVLGFGIWQIPDAEAEAASREALEAGYRSFDSAQLYQNEAGLGRATRLAPRRPEVQDDDLTDEHVDRPALAVEIDEIERRCRTTSGPRPHDVARERLFVTTKVWNSSQGADATARAFDVSLAKLGTGYVDLYLIHWPAPTRGLYVETWKTLVRLKQEGRARSIGVSNFEPEHLEKIIDATGEVPVLNQIELHPHFLQKNLRAFHEKHGIATEAWSPLGQGKLLSDKVLVGIAQKHGRSTAQVILRWHLQHGIIAIPKSVTPARIRENLDVFDFQLDPSDVAAIDGLDRRDGRIGPDPMTATF